MGGYGGRELEIGAASGKNQLKKLTNLFPAVAGFGPFGAKIRLRFYAVQIMGLDLEGAVPRDCP